MVGTRYSFPAAYVIIRSSIRRDGQKGGYSMATPEERLTNLEKITALLQERLSEEGVQKLNRDLTMLLGMVYGQEADIRELQAGTRRIETKLLELDRGLDRVEEHIGSIEQRLGSINITLNEHTERLSSIDTRLDTQDKKLDQMLLLLTALAPKSEQGNA
jgi:chromosome segregation ATPase